MDKKPTDSEIIKALEDITSGGVSPIGKYVISELVLKETLDLINRQKEEKEALINGQETLQKHIAEQKAEVERLNKEVDRLSQCVLYHDGQIVDAIKEFAERLKKKYKPYVILGSGVAEIEIDNLLKELVGDNQ